MKKAFTLAETLIVMLILGFFAVVLIKTMKFGDITQDALIKGGLDMYNQIEVATKKLLMGNSFNYDMRRLKDTSGAEFAITASGADAKLIAVYKKYMKPSRGKTLSSTYKNATLKNASNASVSGVSVSTFTQGYYLKNGTYFAIKLNGNCTTSETYIYSPQLKDKRDATNSCGLIFYDLNGESYPNILGVDQYILSIGKLGIK
ncbi:MAG: type II secretion system protein [Candidatus Gastranaerophilales bacterium]|nr:type II secretion system protein [Candidatus Gastranaerophilales bacterium]